MQSPDTSRDARIAGALYVVVIAAGVFAGIVQDSVAVSGDGAATAAAIAAHESLWRWGIGVHLFYLAFPATILNVLLYRIFKPMAPTLALLGLAFGIVSQAVEASAVLPLFAPLIKPASALAAVGEPNHQAIIHVALRLSELGFSFALIFFSGFCAAIGAAILRSRLLPAAIGVLMIVAAVCYFISTLATVVAPTVAHLLSPWIIIPCFLGEASLAIWLLVKGTRSVDVPPPREDALSYGKQ
jgi:MFS family permease